MQLVQRRPRPLSESECMARLYSGRTSLVQVLVRRAPRPLPVPAEPSFEFGRTDDRPAAHLAIHYPRGRGTMTGEEVRLALFERMNARPSGLRAA